MSSTIWTLSAAAISTVGADDTIKVLCERLNASVAAVTEALNDASTPTSAEDHGDPSAMDTYQVHYVDEATLHQQLQSASQANDIILISAAAARRWLSQQSMSSPIPAAKKKQGGCHNLPAGVIIWEAVDSLSAETAVSWFHRNAADVLLLDTNETACVLTKHLREAISRAARWQQMVSMAEQLLAENQQLQSQQQALVQDQVEGRALQQRLMPPTSTRYDELLVEYINRPALHLSGDFIDHFAIDEHTIGFYLADVSGHGVSSGIVTVLLKSFFARYLSFAAAGKSQRIRDPGEMASKLNARLVSSELGKHIALFYGVYSRDAQTLAYINAGLCPQPWLKCKDVWQTLSVESKPLGLYPNIDYKSTALSISSQFQLIVCSDGWLDCFQFSEKHEKMAKIQQQFQQVVGQYDDQPLGQKIAHLPLDMHQQTDDMSILSIRRHQ